MMKTHPMHCREVEAQLESHLDGSLAGEVSSRIRKHIASCSACSEAQAMLIHLRARARKARKHIIIPDIASDFSGVRQRMIHRLIAPLASAAAIAFIAGSIGILADISGIETGIVSAVSASADIVSSLGGFR